MADRKPHEEPAAEGPLVPGYNDVNSVVQDAFKSLMLATKASNDLPTSGDDYDYYSSFNPFRDLMEVEGQRILHLIQKIMRYQGAKGNLSTSSTAVEIEDKFDVLIDANDQILERVGNFLDEASGIKKTDSQLVIASSSSTKQQISGSWNKKKNSSGGTPGTSYRLLAAKHVQRPQLKFKDKIDNSLRAFIPKIRHKPHAVRPIPESIYQAQQESDKVLTTEDEEYDVNFTYPHPYQFELDHFVPTGEQLEKVTPEVPKSFEETPLVIVESEDSLKDMCNSLKGLKEIAVDLEHHSYRTYQGITCLMQISTRTCDYIVDTLQLRSELHVLNEYFTDPNIVKVFHGADMDIQWLQRDLGVYVVNMFDTGQASKVLNMSRFSLAHLLSHYCGVEADKQYQLADWRIRPLPAELINYAREDTHYLLYIYDIMKNELLEQGNQQKNLLLATLQRSTEVCAIKYEKPRQDGGKKLFHNSKKMFNARQMAAFKGIYSWRDKTARIHDESLSYILPNHMLLQIADVLPKEMQGILACCNPIPPLVRQFLHDLHRIVKEALEVPLAKTEVIKPALKPTSLQHPKYQMDSLLYCPHDKSHEHNTSRVFPIIDSFPEKDADNIVTTRTRPAISAFAFLSGQQKGVERQTESRKKATEIKSRFSNPFQKYIRDVDKAKTTILAPAKLDKQSHPETQWLLLPPKKPEKPENPVVGVVQENISTKVVTELNDDGAIPLRQQAQDAKMKSDQLKRKSEEPISAPKDKPKANPVIESWPPGPSRTTSTIEKKKKLSLEDVAASDFKAHSYDKESFHMFTEKNKRQTKDYDPSTQAIRNKKGGRRGRGNPKFGAKGMSFGKDTQSGGAQWPKK